LCACTIGRAEPTRCVQPVPEKLQLLDFNMLLRKEIPPSQLYL
jgi:hypothetical protein